jgi:hypothetical protein
LKRRTEEVGRRLPELYLHGLAQGDFDLACAGCSARACGCRRRRLSPEGRLAGGVIPRRPPDSPAAFVHRLVMSKEPAPVRL